MLFRIQIRRIQSTRMAMEHDGMEWRNFKRVQDSLEIFSTQNEKAFRRFLICEMLEWQYQPKLTSND